MGIKKLQRLILENKDSICTAAVRIQGELLVDGYGVLHELYENHNLDWANGGRYAEQYQVTVDYFDALLKGGIKPIVVVDGGGCLAQHEDTVSRRDKDVKFILKELKECHLVHSKSSHLLPPLAKELFLSTLRELKVEVNVADGKATRTVVRLANYFQCPVLTNSTNYCVSSIAKGVIFFKHFDVKTCEAAIYEQTRLIDFLKLPNPDLVFAIVSIMGDGNDPSSVQYFYHGRVKQHIEAHIIGIPFSSRSAILNVADFIRSKKFSLFSDFRDYIGRRNGRQWGELLKNCERVTDAYDYSKISTLSIEELRETTTIKCSKPCDLPIEILHGYRSSLFPVFAVNAVSLGKCVLDQAVGDEQQPAPVKLGLPVRQLMYGLMSSLMNRGKGIQEYFSNVRKGELRYESHEVSLEEHKELCITDLPSLDLRSKKALLLRSLCQVLQCSEDVLSGLEDMSILMLATYYWAQHLLKKEIVPNCEQVIKALLVNFFLNLSDPVTHRQSEIDQSQFSNSAWIQVYHALLEWQCLYLDVCCINLVFGQPLDVTSPCYLFDGPLVIYLALHPSPQAIDMYVERMDQVKRDKFVKSVDFCIPT